MIEGVQQILQPAMEASYESKAADLPQQAYTVAPVHTQQTALMEQMMTMMQLMQQQL